MNKTKNIGGWLNSKQKTTKSLELLGKYEEYYTNMDSLLRKRVVQQVKNNRTMIGRSLYKTKDIYEDNMSLEEYVNTIISFIGVQELSNAIEKAIDIILRKDKTLKKFTRLEIKKAMKCYIFYQPYIGYSFECRIRDILEKEGYEVHRWDDLDLKYAIDMQVYSEKDQKVIGLQLKSKSFLGVGIDKRQNYLDRNKRGILYKYCEEVYYVFHDVKCEIMACDYSSVVDYKVACTTQKPIVMLEWEEEFIKELKGIFERR